jgi:hypothetical protein
MLNYSNFVVLLGFMIGIIAGLFRHIYLLLSILFVLFIYYILSNGIDKLSKSSEEEVINNEVMK